jgi:hypothetical protein
VGKVVKAVAIIALAAAVAYFAPQFLPALIGSGALATAVTTAVVSAAISIAATTAASLVIGRPSAAGSSTPSVFRQAIANSFLVYGKRRVGGLLIFFHPRTVGKEHWRYFVIAVAGHRCKGVTRWWFGDEEVTVGAGGAVTSGKYAGNAWLDFYRGNDDQAAHPTFVAETAGKWTAEHRGRGAALIYARFRMTDEVAQAGMPNITCEVEGKDDILDPRTDSRGYTRNAALIFYDFMALPREIGGFGCYDDEIDWDWVAAQASVCDEQVATPAGPEPRYAFDSYITTGAAPSEVRDTFVTCCAGSFTFSGGKMLLRPGYYVPPSATLSEDDVAGPLTVPVLREGDQTATEVAGTFIDPSSLYQSRDVPTRSVVSDDIRQASYDLAHVTSIYQGQRLLEFYLRKTLAERRVTWPMNIMGIGVSALDTVQLGTQRYGLDNYAFQVTGWGLAPDFSVTLQLEETGPELFDFDPASYLEPGNVPTLARADVIDDRPTRAAYQVIGQDVEYPVTTTDTSIIVTTFRGTIDDSRIIDFPAGQINGLENAANYRLFYALEDVQQPLRGADGQPLTGPEGTLFTIIPAGSYHAAPLPALDELANASFVAVRKATTAAAGGTTYPPATTPPGGDGGGGYGGGGEFAEQRAVPA